MAVVVVVGGGEAEGREKGWEILMATGARNRQTIWCC